VKLPNLAKLDSDGVEPRLAYILMDIADHRDAKSRILPEPDTRKLAPATERLDPIRAKAFMDSLDPRLTRSSTDRTTPKRTEAHTLDELPTRMNSRILRLLPTATAPSTDCAAPKRPTVNVDSVLLSLTAALAEKEDPIDAEAVIEALLATRATPAADSPLPRRMAAREDRLEPNKPTSIDDRV
jgi:hypothetical protein